jgi:purine-binding chemotaxis protein CheW
VAGLVNLRGEIVCALETRAILGMAPRTAQDTPFLVVLKGFKDPVALVVDSIADIYGVDPARVEPPQESWPAEETALLAGTIDVAAGTMGLLELDRVMQS